MDRAGRQAGCQGRRGGGEPVAALAEVVRVRWIDGVPREPQPAFDPAQEFTPGKGEGRNGQRVDGAQQCCEVIGSGRPDRVGEPVPECDRMSFDQPGRRFGRADRGDARFREPLRHGQFTLRPLQQLRGPAHLDDEPAVGEDRVLAQGQQFRVRCQTGSQQYVPRCRLVHVMSPALDGTGPSFASGQAGPDIRGARGRRSGASSPAYKLHETSRLVTVGV